MAKSRTLGINPLTFDGEVRSHFDEDIASLRVTAGSEAANARTLTLQVIDRVKREWKDRFLIEVWLQATATGAPSATGNTVAWVTGTVTETVLPNAHWRVITTVDGLASLDVTIAGAATRYVGFVIGSIVQVSSAITWAA